MESNQVPLIGQVIRFAGHYAPVGWMYCEGQLLLIQQYEPLFSLLGTSYGGDGIRTFALPDLRDREPILKDGSWITSGPRYIICMDGVYPRRP
jgi:microcystin-dependent protein